jgi:hypothetical protein
MRSTANTQRSRDTPASLLEFFDVDVENNIDQMSRFPLPIKDPRIIKKSNVAVTVEFIYELNGNQTKIWLNYSDDLANNVPVCANEIPNYQNKQGIFEWILRYTAISFVFSFVFNSISSRIAKRLDVIEHAINNIECGGPIVAQCDLKNIPVLYQFILSSYYPGNYDLKWRFNYLNSLVRIKNNSIYDGILYAESALKHATCDDQRYLALKNLINAHQIKHEMTRLKFTKNSSDSMRAVEYISQVSTNCNRFREEEAEFSRQINSFKSVLLEETNIRSERIHNATDLFNLTHVDYSTQKLFPNLYAKHLQLHAIFTLLSQFYPLSDALDIRTRFRIVHNDLLKIQDLCNLINPLPCMDEIKSFFARAKATQKQKTESVEKSMSENKDSTVNNYAADSSSVEEDMLPMSYRCK